MRRQMYVAVFALILSILLSLSFSVSASDAVSYKVYPFEPYITGGTLVMTPNGSYTFKASGGAASDFVMAVSNNRKFDYESKAYLYLKNVDSSVKFIVYADFHNTLDGYFTPTTVVYSSEKTKEELIKIAYRSELEKAGKWSPSLGYLFIKISCEHRGDADAYTTFGGIYLGGEDLALSENTSKAVKIAMTESEYIGNGVFSADGSNFKPETLNSTAYAMKCNISATAENHYVYVNFKNLPSNNWPYIYLYNDSKEICGTFPSVVRVRPEMKDSDVWVRIDLAEWSDSFKEDNDLLAVKLVLETPSGASGDGITLGGVYVAGDMFDPSDIPSPVVPETSEDDEKSEEEVSVIQNQPVDPNAPKTSEEESREESKPAVTSESEESSTAQPEKEEKGNTTVIIAVCAAVVAVCAAAAVIAVTRKKH